MRGQPVRQRSPFIVGDGIDLGAVAGGEQGRLAHLWQPPQCRQRDRYCVRGERHPLAQAHRRGLVVDAEHEQACRRTGGGRTHVAWELPVQVLAISCWLPKPAILPAPPNPWIRQPMPAAARSFPFAALVALPVALATPAAGARDGGDVVVDSLEPLLAAEFSLQAGRLD